MTRPYEFHEPHAFTRVMDGRHFNVEEAPREVLIAMLEWNDPNGCYSDADSTLEFGNPATIEELRACAREIWEV